jgi:hypothetical protein
MYVCMYVCMPMLVATQHGRAVFCIVVQAPVLHATPTPCVPTTIDAEGESLDPFLDPYEVLGWC